MKPPSSDEFELTLLGPGYGESILLHVGAGSWIVVDSYQQGNRPPAALGYLEQIGVDPETSVELIVATHWHDDHIRGISNLVDVCKNATFCCSAALVKKEFLGVVEALAGRDVSSFGSGVDELQRVFSRIPAGGWTPIFALANRRILRKRDCEVYSLSPDDPSVVKFLRNIGSLIPGIGESLRRAPQASPNEVSVVLWIKSGDTTVLLGADMEKMGWVNIVQDPQRPIDKASVFKVAHHGSQDAHDPQVWQELLVDSPYALVAPWSRGGRVLPKRTDVERILSFAPNAYVTVARQGLVRSPARRDRMVERTIRDAGVRLYRRTPSSGGLRLRRRIGSGADWEVEKWGPACHLSRFAA